MSDTARALRIGDALIYVSEMVGRKSKCLCLEIDSAQSRSIWPVSCRARGLEEFFQEWLEATGIPQREKAATGMRP